MHHFDSTKMSADEYDFIRLYCATVKHDYPLIVLVNHLADPENLGVSSILEASYLAQKIKAMEDKLGDEIEAMGTINKRAAEKYKDEVSNKQVAHVFTQSFFKLVDSATKSALIIDKEHPQHDGWSSGHPLQWQQVIKSLNDVYVQKKNTPVTAHTSIINALINLFSLLPKHIKDGNAHYEFYDTKESDWEEEYEEEEDDDDDYFQDLWG